MVPVCAWQSWRSTLTHGTAWHSIAQSAAAMKDCHDQEVSSIDAVSLWACEPLLLLQPNLMQLNLMLGCN